MDFNLHKELLVKKLILQILTKKKFIQPNSILLIGTFWGLSFWLVKFDIEFEAN